MFDDFSQCCDIFCILRDLLFSLEEQSDFFWKLLQSFFIKTISNLQEARDGKRKPIATVRVDIAQYVNAVSASHDIELLLKPLTAKVKSTRLTCSITCNFLSAGPAT